MVMYLFMVSDVNSELCLVVSSSQFDEDEDGILFPEEILDALEYVNSNLLSDSHLNYIFRVL